MKKLISICLVLVLTGGFIVAANTQAEAMDPASAALIAASFMFLPVIAAVSSHEHDHYRPAATYYGETYYDPYPVRTRVYYSAPRYDGYYGNWNRGYAYERDHRRHRWQHEDRRVRDHDRYRYASRHNRYND